MTRVEPRTGSIVATIAVGNGPSALASRRGRGLGRQPARRHALAHRPGKERGGGGGLHRWRPDRGGRRWRSRVGGRWRGRRRRACRSGRAACDREGQDREQPGGGHRRRRVGLGCGRRPAGRASRWDPARAHLPPASVDPRSTPCTRARIRVCTRFSSARWPTTVSSATGGSPARPARRLSARWPRPRRRRAATGAAMSSRCGAGCGSRTAGPCGPRTSGRRWSASSRSPATTAESRRSRRSTRASLERRGACVAGRATCHAGS